MSKRFGRNQRRKLQAQIAEVRDAHSLDRALISYQRESLRRVEQTLERIRQMFGKHFSGLDAVTLPLCTGKVPPSINVIDLGARDLAATLDYNLAKLNYHSLTCSQVKLRIDEMTGQRHVRVATAAGEVAYAFSPTAFRGMPQGEIIQILATSMAQHLATSPEMRGFL